MGTLLELMETYRRALDYGDGPFNRDAVSPLYRQDEIFTAYDLAPPNGGYIGWEAYATGGIRLPADIAAIGRREIVGGEDFVLPV